MAPPGPAPSDPATKRRRNEPTIPTTNLPAAGSTERAPKVPAAYDLQAAGKAWWRWAWKTPQAAAWDPGSLYALARRAQLEDELAAIGAVPESDITAVMAEWMADAEERQKLVALVVDFLGAIQRAAGPANAIRREMRELDDRFGLTAKGMIANRWKIVPDKTSGNDRATAPTSTAAVQARAAAAGLRRVAAVDPAALE